MNRYLLSISLNLSELRYIIYEKGIPWLNMTKEVLSDIILHFFGSEQQIYEKLLMEFSLSSFSNSLNMKKDWALTIVRLVKT